MVHPLARAPETPQSNQLLLWGSAMSFVALNSVRAPARLSPIVFAGSDHDHSPKPCLVSRVAVVSAWRLAAMMIEVRGLHGIPIPATVGLEVRIIRAKYVK